MISYGRQDITEDDLRAVEEVLRSDFLTQGPAVPRFEARVAERCGARHAVAMNSATSALHVACLALGLGPGDLLWTVPNTFVASANCGRYCGADVDFVDIDRDTWNMDTAALADKLARARAAGRLPKVVVPVHFAGQPIDQERIWALAQEYGFKVIEDASHAIGAARNGEAVGSCRWSHVTIFSFHPVKIITSGEGGMALTNDAALAEHMVLLRSHGITREAERLESPAPGPWYYEQQMLGFNYRMTDIHAALGASQVARLDGYVARRNELALEYRALLAALPLQCQAVEPGSLSSYHLFAVQLGEGVADRHARLFDRLRSAGFGVNLHYMPVHLQPYYRRLGFKAGDFPVAEAYAQAAVTLPLFPTMDADVPRCVVEVVAATLG